MANKVVGYLGLDNYENIFYLARILYHLDKKVLLVEHSESLSLQLSVPIPKNLDCEKTVITYRGIDFTSQIVNDQMLAEYDAVIISYGFGQRFEDLGLCSNIIVVTDLHSHNTYRIQRLFSAYFSTIEVEISLHIKDIVDCKITPETITKNTTQTVPFDHISILYHDTQDLKNALLCQYNSIFKFTKVTKQLKNYLWNEIIDWYPEIESKVIKKAYTKARRGD